MKKICFFVSLFSLIGILLVACSCNCEKEPIVESNHKLIVPPNFGNMPD